MYYLDEYFRVGEPVGVERKKWIKKHRLRVFVRKGSAGAGQVAHYRQADAAVSLDDGITVGELQKTQMLTVTI